MSYLRLLRPHQWIKNILILFPGLLAFGLEIPVPWPSIFLCLVSFCLASSAIYVINDIIDAERDRAHPVKKRRPIACGDVGSSEGYAIAASLGAIALVLAYKASPVSLGLVASYCLINLGYSYYTKHIPLLDCGSIALGFSLRFLAGGAGFAVPANPILLSACFFGAFAMALIKRRIELSLVLPGESAQRPSLEGLNLPVLDLLVGIFSSVAISLYAQWTLAHSKSMVIFTLPLLVLAVSRVIWLAYLNKKGEDFAKTLLSDLPCLLLAGLFIATIALALHA